MNHTAILSSSSFFPLHLFLSLHLTPASLPLGIFLPCLLPFFLIISSPRVSVSLLPSKHTCPNLFPLPPPPLSPRSLMNIKRRAQALLQTLFHFLLPHSRYFVHLLFFFFFSNRILPCNYFPMNISSLLNGSCRVCVFVYVFMSSFTNT